MTERSFVMVKPDGVAAGLTGEIITRIERRGLAILALRKAVMARDVAQVHYGEHSERPFFGELVEFITSGPVVMMAVEGEGAVGALRTMMGPTDPQDAPPGTDPRRLRPRRGAERHPRLRRHRLGRPRAGPALPRSRGLTTTA